MESDKNPDDTMSRAHRWHIPRPSLGGSSGAGGGSGAGSTAGGDQRARGGSASSQGSSSNHSTHSASSGSLLLSAANLARVHGNGRPGAYHANLSAYVDRSRRAGEHRRLHRTDGPQSNVSIPEEIVSTPSSSISPSPPASGDPFWSSGEFKLTSNRHMNKENALDSFSRRSGTTDPSLVEFPHHSTKTDPSGTEAADSSTSSVDPFWSSVKLAGGRRPASVASSTHFTVVNGFTRRTGKPEPRSYCCDASHQVTVLVVTMTVLISACILAAICFVEMRLRRDANFRFS